MFKQFATSKSRARKSGRRGWTLVETMVSLAFGTAVMGSMLPTGVTVTNSMAAIGNYCDLNRKSCNALDMLSRDLRNTATVIGISDRQVTVSNVITSDVISYSWDGSDAVTRNFNGESRVMLTGCDYLKFSSFQRNPTNNFQFLPASSPATTKLISVSWRCSRKIIGAKINTESVQTAQICIRN